MMRRRRSVTLWMAALLALGFVSSASGQKRFEPGQAFPELVLPSIENGSPLSISDFRGQKLMLHVWASW